MASAASTTTPDSGQASDTDEGSRRADHIASSPSGHEGLWLAGIIVAYTALSVALIAQGAPFGHDEAVYSLRARHLTQDATPVFYWSAYRAPGLPFILQSAWLGPATEPFLRLLVAAFGVPLIVSTWIVGRTLIGIRVGLVAAAGVALTPTVLGAATQVWPDIPGAALGMAAIGLYTWAISRQRVSRWVLVVPVLVFFSTMLRFGAPIPIAIGLAGITLWGWRHALLSWRLIAATAILTFVAAVSVLFVPALTGWAQIGDPIAPYAAISALTASRTSPWYQSLFDYWRFRDLLVGGFVSGAMMVGVGVGIVVAIQRSRIQRGFLTSLGIGVATALALAWFLHGEPRYLAPMFPWIWIASAVGLVALVPRLDRRTMIAAAVLLAVVFTADSYDRSGLQNDFNASQYQRIKGAARMIDDATEDEACSVLSSYTSQVGWYSHCLTRRLEVDEVVVDSPWFPDGPRYLYLVEGGKRQPEGDVLDEYLAVSTGPEYTAGDPGDGRRQYIEVHLVEP